MENKSNTFVDGLRVYKPSEKAPEFIIANLEFDVVKLNTFLEAHANDTGKVRAVIKMSREGNRYYAALDSYTAERKPEVKEDPSASIPF